MLNLYWRLNVAFDAQFHASENRIRASENLKYPVNSFLLPNYRVERINLVWHSMPLLLAT